MEIELDGVMARLKQGAGVKGRDFTSNTLIRVAVAFLLEHDAWLSGTNEREVFDAFFAAADAAMER